MLVGGWWGYQWWLSEAAKHFPTPPIPPGRFTLLGLKPNDEYSIYIAGETAFIAVATSGSFAKGDQGTIRDRVPTSALVQAKGGNKEALGKLVMRMNKEELEQEDAPTNPKLWLQSDIQKALDGDKALAAKLEADLGMPLRPGGLIPPLTPAALDNGIAIRLSIPVNYELPGARTMLNAEVDVPFRPEAAKAAEQSLGTKNLSPSVYLGEYRKRVASSQEDVSLSLRRIIDPARLRQFAQKTEDLLDKTFIILTEKQITGADFTTVPPAPYKTRSTYDLHLDINPEGRGRLWRYSELFGGRTVLVLVDDAAIEGSKLSQGMNVSHFTITELKDKRRVAQAVQLINERAGRKSAQNN